MPNYRGRGEGGLRVIPERPNRNFKLIVNRIATNAISASLSYLMAAWPVMAQQPNVIIPDGRTQTQVQTAGAVTNITTATVSGVNGFNSFSRFGVGSGNTVNLQLPGGTQNLINLVHDAPAYVNGTLNAYKDGRIGGNVYFADPYGFVVGRSGVVNVGSLTVSTPTREFVDSVISPSGQINEGAVGKLLAGTVPISPDGTIRIRGRVNAVDAVRLTGQNVFVGSGRDAVNRDHAIKFASTVNSRGLHSANGIVVRNGSIQIVASNRASVSSRLVARSRTNTGGDIVITAGKAIRIASTAKLKAASKRGNAGNIILRAGSDLTVKSGASFDASSAVGNAGVVELSSFGTFNVASGFKVNLGAPNGQKGTLLVDPTVVVIGDSSLDTGVTMSNATVASMIAALTEGGTFQVSATGTGDSITLAPHAVIDTRRLNSSNVSTGNAYNVELDSPTIDIQAGAKILAQAVNANGSTWTSGTVSLVATASNISGLSLTELDATTGIDIAGTITGASISAVANSTASLSVTNYSALGMAQFGARFLLGALTGVNGNYLKSSATAKVTLESTANLTASGAVTLSSVGSETASDPAITFSVAALQNAIGVAVIVGIVDANIATEVKSGATISSGDLNVLSSNNATLDVSALSASTQTKVGGSFAYSTGTVNTRALVDPGATITKVGNVTVGAQNTNSFSTSASTFAAGTGSAGVSVALSDMTNNAVANLGASLPSSASAGAVTVYSGSNTTSNAVSASASVGSSWLVADGIQSFGGTFLSSVFGGGGTFDSTGAGQSASSQGTLTTSRAGVVLSLNLASLNSSASIAAVAPDATTGNMTASGTAPTIVASGGVGVISTLTDGGIRGNAESTINSPDTGTSSNPATTSALSMAVNVDQLTQSSNAYIGSGVSVTAPYIGVHADMSSPITNTWTDFDSFSAVTSHLNANGGIVNNILTSYANATFDGGASNPNGSPTGIAGAVNYFEITSNTTAWVGSGATLTQSGTSQCGGTGTCWSSNLAASGLGGAPTSVSWANDIVVTAATSTSTINIGGNFSWLTLFGTNSSSQQGTAVGGSANVNIFNTSTVAGIGAGASVTTNGTLDVSATTSDLIYAVAPTSGKGAGLGLNGVVSVLQLDNTTTAAIDSSATVSAETVNIDAEQHMSSFDVGGGVGASKGTGVGVVVAIAAMSADTSAFIGDSSNVLSATGATADDSNLTPTSAGSVSAFDLYVDALTVGRLTTVSVAAQYNNDAPNSTPSTQVPATQPSSLSSAAILFFKNVGTGISTKLTNAYNALAAKTSGPVQAQNSTAGAGSAAVDLTSLTTSASIAHNATVKYTPGGNNHVTVQALNNTIIDTAGGAAAVSKGAPGTNYTVGLAGAVAVTISSDMTTATISSSSITANSTTVQALAGGQSTTVGLAVALTTGTSTSSGQASASVSIAQIDDGVQAGIDSSTVGQAVGGSGNAGALSIVADETTNIGIGAGSLYGGFGSGNSNGFGVALTYAEIGDPSSGAGVSAVLSNSSVQNTASLNVEALNTSRIISGAAVGGGGADASGFAGSVVVNDIDPTILAEITSTPAVSGTAAVTGGITVSGDVTVTSSGGSVATLDALIANAATAGSCLTGSTCDSGIDFTGSALSPTNTTGAAILAVAGNVQITGKSNVGISIVVNRIGTRHEALIDGASVTSTGGVVSVSANDDSEILGIAIGVSAAGGSMAGNGSFAYNAIDNDVIAQIGHGANTSDPVNTATATVAAAAVAVTANDDAKIRGAAGAISINIKGGNAVGLSAAINQISTYVSAAAVGAHVTADNTLSDSSPLVAGNLRAGAVLVAGNSDADILTISIGTAITVGNNTNSPPPTPQQNLSSLVGSMKPGTPSSLTGFGGGGVTPPTAPSAPAAPSVPSTGMAGAGSFAISTEGTSVYSAIGSGGNGYNSAVDAKGNALVLASNSDSISAYAGALSISAGAKSAAGASVVVNTINGTTSAQISNSGVDAHGLGAGATVDNGTMATAIDPSSAVTPATDPNLADGTQTINGIAVVATSRQSADTVSVVGAVASTGGAMDANAVPNVMGGTTSAQVLSSNLNKNLSSGEISAVQVTAASASFANNLDIGMADSASSASGTIALAINTMNRTTTAKVDSSDIGSSGVPVGAVGVLANSFQGTSGEVVGAAGSGSSGGFAGSALTNLFQATTTASLDHGNVYSGALSVQGNGLNGFFAAAGAGALGGSAGIGATVIVTTSDNTVQALVGDSDASTAATSLHLTGALVIAASNRTNTSSYAIVGALGGTAGIAAQFSGMFITNTVDAELDNASVTNTATTAADEAVTVSATETDSITPIVGGVAGGGTAGLGAGVNLVILKSNTKALMAGATVTTGGDVAVTALSNRAVKPITAIAGLGGQVGIAGTVGVVLIGSAATSDEMSVLNAGATSGDSNSGTLGNAGAATGTDVVAATGSGVDGISAQIIGGSVTANKVDISATSNVATRNIVGALAVGLGGGGFGAAVGYTDVDQTITAKATGGSLTTPTLSIAASAGDESGSHAAESWGIAGAGGLYVGIGAAVGDSNVDNTIVAELGSTTDGGSTGAASGTIAVSATDASSLASYGYGFGAGAAAVGLSLGFSNKKSSVTADFAPSTSVTNFANVAIGASGSGSVAATTYAGAAGIASGAGASAQGSDNETIVADIGHNASVSAAVAGVLVNATAAPDVSTTSYGVAVGGVGMGASVAESTAAVNVSAYVDHDSTISGGGLTITASALLPGSGHTAHAYAVAAGGGTLFGGQATYVDAEDNSNVTAYGGTGLHLPSANVTIAAENDTNQLSEALGVAAGWIGVGATVAETSSNGSSVAYLDTGAVTAASNLGVLSITATGTDSNTSNATAGSGGVYAGAAAIANTTSTSTTTATLKGNTTQDTLYFGGLGINAAHTVSFSADADAFQASVVGASGGGTNNTVNDTVTAEVGPYLIINSAGGNMNVIASDTVNEASGGARAGSGGVAAGAATLSSSTVTQTVESHIDNHTIFSLNDNPATSTASIDIEAYNFLNTVDSVSLSAGGLFAGGGAQSYMTATAADSVVIDDNVTLFSAGNIAIGTAARMAARNNANADLYGLITGAGADTKSDLKATQSVTVGDSLIEGWGTIGIYAGQSGDGAYTTTVSANGTTVVYNYALIPITAVYKGASSAESDATLTLATGSRVLGANNVSLGSTWGTVASNGSGTNYNPYLSLFSTENHDDAGATPVTSADAILNGTIAAGIHHQDIITIAYNGTVTLSPGTSPYALTLEQVSDPSQFSPVMSYNHQTIQYAIVGGFNPKLDVLSQIASLSGQTCDTTCSNIKAEIGSPNPPTAQNDDSAGTKQRQINTLIQEIAYMADASGPSYVFGNIVASAGNVSILANTLSGAIVNGVTPSVTAYDSPKISIDNQGIDFLFVHDLLLSGVSGGRVNFTGAATDSSVVQSATQGITFSRDLSAQTPSIIVNASYNATNVNRQPIDQNGNVLATTPDIYFGGTVTTYSGLLSVTNQLGNVLLAGTMNAGTVSMNVPNGMIGGSLGANSVYNSNYDVASQWTSVEYRPTDIVTAVEAAATYLGAVAPPGTTGIAYVDGNANALPYYYYTGEGNGPQYAPVNSSGYGNPSAVFTARLMALFYGYGSLYSALFLPVSTGYGPVPLTSGASGSDWERHAYQGQAYWGDDSGPFNCSGCGNFFQIVQLQSQVISGVTANAASASAPSTINAGKALIISASIVNINGNISVGQSSNYSVNIGTDALNAINALKGNATALALAKSNAASGHYVDLTDDVAAANGSDVKIAASYNAATDQIMLSPVVQGTGGYVYLNGKIISTSSSGSSMGNITVHGGAGTVTVNNTTGVDLVTNVINTGVSAASVIEFVDQSKNQTTWYVYNAGAPSNQQVSVYQQAGVNNGGYSGLSPTSVTANANLQYLPADQLYQWTDSTHLTRADSTDVSVFGWNFVAPANGGLTDYSRTQGTVINGTQATNFSETVTATGSYVTHALGTADAINGTDFKNGTWYQERYDDLTLTMTNRVKANFGINLSFTGGGTSNIAVTSNSNIVIDASINNLQGNTSLTATGVNSKGTPSAIVNGASPFVSGVSIALSAPGGIGAANAPLPIATYGGQLTATSVDSDIAISAAGGLSIAQVKANPAVTGAAPQGNIYLSATGDITSATPYDLSNPIVVGKSITINTSGGAIGAVSGVDSNGLATLTNINPIVIEATATALSDGTFDGGLLNSTSAAGAYIIQSTGNLRLGTVSSTGALFLAAAAADGQPANILNGVASGGLTKAQTDYLKSVWSDLDLLNTSCGSANCTPQSVVSYQSMINAAYNDYWQLRNIAFSDGVTYAISALGTKAIGAQLIAAGVLAQGTDLVTPSTATQTAIQTEANNRFMKDEYLLGLKTTAQLGVSLDTLFGTQAGQGSQFQAAVSTSALTAALTTYNSSFAYTLPTASTLYTNLASGSQWTQDQLTYIVSAGANPENNTPPPSIASLPLNVSGRQVMLYAPNGTIGSLATPQTFSFTSDGSLPLTDVQKALMASAGPGQLTVTTSTYNGPNGAVPEYTVSIAQQSLVKVSSLGTVSAKAQDQIYLGSASDLSLGGIPVATFGPIAAAYSAGVQTIGGGDVLLQAVGSILGGVAGQVAISGDITNLTLISETGSIGAAALAGVNPAQNDNALLLALSGATVGNLDQLQATHGIYIRQTTGDLVLGNVNAGSGADGVLQLAATGSIYAESGFTDRTAVHVVASALDLRAGGSVGFNGATLQPLQVKISGAITGTAVGDMTILSPNSNMTVGAAGTYGVLTSGGALTLDTIAGTIAINADVTSTGAMDLLANAAITFADGTSASPVVAQSTGGAITLASASLNMGAYSALDAAGVLSVVTTGDVMLGQLRSAASYAAAGNAASIVVQAGGVTTGNIFSNGDGSVNLVTTGAGARSSMTANTIGTASQRVTVSSQSLAATASDGSIYLTAAPDMRATLLSAVEGTVDVTGAASYTLDSVLASTAAGATGHFIAQTTGPGTLTVGTATGRGTLRLLAADSVSFGSLTSLALAGDPGDVIVTAGDGAILGGSITAYGGVTLTAGANLPVGSPLAANAKITGTGNIASSTFITLSARGQIDWETLNAATTIDVTSTDGGARVGTATTVGSITMHGKQDVAFDQLTNTAAPGQGDVTLTSDNGSIIGGSITSNGAVSLIAAGSISATGAAGNGGTLNWSVLHAGGSMFLHSLGDAITIDVAESGGTLTLWAKNNVTFRQVTATGSGSDIVLRSDEGAIIALGTGLVNVDAGGSVTMNAATSITGAEVRAGGAVGMTATNGQIAWNAVTAGTTVDVRSSGDVVDIATITSGGTQTLWAENNVTFTQLTATTGGADITSNTGAIVGGSVALGGATRMVAKTTISGTTATSTAGAMEMSAEGMITWNAVDAAGGSLTITSTRETMDVPSLSSGGKMTLDVAQDMLITQITTTGIPNDAGDVAVTSHTGRITGGTIAANGGVTLDAPISITGVSATGATGAVFMNTNGLIDWATVIAGTTVNARSTADSVHFDSVTSGGTQTIRAANNVDFNRLTTNGVIGDAGDVIVAADTGYIQGTTVAAHGSASLAAATTNKGTTLVASTGSATLTAGGLIDWATLNAGTTIGVHSTGDAIDLVSATSGGSQTIHANQDVTFGHLTTTGIPGDLGDITVTSDNGSITGTSVSANGNAAFNSGNSINVTTMQAGSATLSTPHDLTLGLLSVYRAMTLGADIIDVTAKQLPSVPPVPLHVTVTGYRGGVATHANLTIDPPQVIIDTLSIMDSTIDVDSPNLTITNGYVPGQMMLTTPAGEILLDNRGPGPVGGANLQLYEPGGVFTMQQIGNANFSNTQVVYYDTTISSTIINYGGGSFTGSSFIRNSLQDMRNGDNDNLDVTVLRALYFQGLVNGEPAHGPIEVIGNGPAVNIEGLFGTGTKRKGRRKNIHRTSMDSRHGADFASIAYGR